MEPIVREYHKNDRNDCLEAFKSNIPNYFTRAEIADFENFLLKLESGNKNTRFYVVVSDKKVIGCGGFGDKENNGIISLAWGLIHSSFHKKAFGEKLLLYRIEQIKQLYPGVQIILDTTQFSYRFFEKYGFRTIIITNDFYTIGMHRYDMVFKV